MSEHLIDENRSTIHPLLAELIEVSDFKGPLYLTQAKCYELIGNRDLADAGFKRAAQCGVTSEVPAESVQSNLHCPKCLSVRMHSVYLPAPISVHAASEFAGISQYLCIDCGYLEHWVSDQAQLQRIRERIMRKNEITKH